MSKNFFKQIRLEMRTLGVVLVLPLLSFQKSMASSDAAAQKVKSHAKQTVDATAEWTSEKKAEFQKKLQSEVDGLDKELQELKNNVKAHGNKLDKGAREEIARIEQRRKDLGEKIHGLSSATGKAWEHLHDGIDSAWKDLKDSFKKASDEVKKTKQ